MPNESKTELLAKIFAIHERQTGGLFLMLSLLEIGEALCCPIGKIVKVSETELQLRIDESDVKRILKDLGNAYTFSDN